MDILFDSQENYNSGWVKLFRSLKNKGWYKKSDYVHLWVHLLIKCNHSEYEFMFNGENIKLKPGQFITGRKILNSETGINESKIERILNFFEKNEQQIEQQKSNKNRLITVLSWSDYQQSEQQIEQQLNNKRTTTEQQVNTYKNDKKEKNKDISIDLNILLKDKDVRDAFTEYLDLRKKWKLVNSERVVNRLVKKLREYSENKKGTALEIIDKAITGKWKDFYPLTK